VTYSANLRMQGGRGWQVRSMVNLGAPRACSSRAWVGGTLSFCTGSSVGQYVHTMKLNTVLVQRCTYRLDFWVDALHPPQIPTRDTVTTIGILAQM
jgi:hypothetical protein